MSHARALGATFCGALLAVAACAVTQGARAQDVPDAGATETSSEPTPAEASVLESAVPVDQPPPAALERSAPESATPAPSTTPDVPHEGMAPVLEDRSQDPDEYDWVAERAQLFRGPDLELYAARAVDATLIDELGFGFGIAAHMELMFTQWLGLHAGMTFFQLPSTDTVQSAFYWGLRAGLRLHWTTLFGLRGNDGWIDIHDAFGRSGASTRHGFDIGIGYDFRVADLMAVGPFARLLWASDPLGFDPIVLMFGVSIEVDPPTRRFKKQLRMNAEEETHVAEHMAESPFLRSLQDNALVDEIRDQEPIVADGELHVARNLDTGGARDLNWGGGAAAHVEIVASRLVGIHLGGVVHALPASASSGLSTVTYLGSRAGIRLHWTQALGWQDVDGWIDMHHAFGTSGGIARHGFDAGTGFGFHIAPEVSIGPFVRLTYGSDPNGNDPMLLTFGATIGLLPGVRHGRSVDDQDQDGVADFEDRCPREHMTSSHPSATNRGCPERDADHDGWHDGVDECTSEPEGEHPDPAHRGCPLRDRDGDGTMDDEDICPNEPGESADPLHTGCP